MKQELELKKIDYVNVVLVELKALFKNKYRFDFFNPFYDKKTYWEIHKPKFRFDKYPESKVDDTVWIVEFFYVKVKRTN
jgi:hypothetical protein